MVMVLVVQSQKSKNFKSKTIEKSGPGYKSYEICQMNNNKTLVAFRKMPAAKNNKQHDGQVERKTNQKSGQKSSQVQRQADRVSKRYKKSGTVKVQKPQIALQLPQIGTYIERKPQRKPAGKQEYREKPRRENPNIRQIGRVMNANVNNAQREHEERLMEFARKYYWRYADLAKMERDAKKKMQESDRREEEANAIVRECERRDERSKRREERSKQQEKETEMKMKEEARREKANDKTEKQHRIVGALLKNQKTLNDKRRRELDYERDVVWQLGQKLEAMGGGKL